MRFVAQHRPARGPSSGGDPDREQSAPLARVLPNPRSPGVYGGPPPSSQEPDWLCYAPLRDQDRRHEMRLAMESTARRRSAKRARVLLGPDQPQDFPEVDGEAAPVPSHLVSK